MELGHAAIVWSVARQQERASAPTPDAPTTSRKRAGRLAGQLRRFAYRAQLGPATGHGAA